MRGAGLKKCRPDHPVGPVGAHGQVDDGEGRRVGGEDGLLHAQQVELPEQLALGGQVLDDRLDDQAAQLEVLQVGGGADPAQGLVGVGRRQLVLVDLELEGLGQPGKGGVGAGLGTAPDDDLEAGLGRHFGDAGGHHPGSGDAY